jgi:hypothetical protein
VSVMDDNLLDDLLAEARSVGAGNVLAPAPVKLKRRDLIGLVMLL